MMKEALVKTGAAEGNKSPKKTIKIAKFIEYKWAEEQDKIFFLYYSLGDFYNLFCEFYLVN